MQLTRWQQRFVTGINGSLKRDSVIPSWRSYDDEAHMIASLRGRLVARQAPSVVIECQGVGYELETNIMVGQKPKEIIQSRHGLVAEV